MGTVTQVLIAGGGPTGLACAVELGRRGIDCVVVEPRREVERTRPRAKTTSIRTMEHFRRFGLAERIREAAPLEPEWSQDIVFCVTLLGPEVARFHECFGLTPERREEWAETSQQIPQPIVEEVLRRAVSELASCTLVLGSRVETVHETGDGVEATLVDEAGGRRTARAEYVVGADGAGGAVRPAIGAAYEGEAHPRPNLTAVFEAPGLAELVPHGPAIQYWTLDPDAPSYMGRYDLERTWWIGLIGVDVRAGGVDVGALIDRAVGRPIGARVLATDPWLSQMRHADAYRRGRVLLAGDAAHLNPPWGGHGFNTGIGDAVNAGWKLAAVLQGWGGEALLASYEEERRPIAEETIRVARRHVGLLSADFADPVLREPGPAGEAARRAAGEEIRRAKFSEFHALGLVLGYSYAGSSVVVDDGTPAPEPELTRYEPTARPGSRLPHAWLDGRSLYDALGEGFTLLRVGEADPEPLVRAAAERCVPLAALDLRGRGLERRYGAPLLLVRPDQHVAWRGASATDPGTLLDRICGLPVPARRG